MFERGPIGAMHGSPWAYDTHVKIIFSGPGIKAAKINRLVHPVDVAPTLSALVGLSPPAAAQGEVLVEVVNNLDASDRWSIFPGSVQRWVIECRPRLCENPNSENSSGE